MTMLKNLLKKLQLLCLIGLACLNLTAFAHGGHEPPSNLAISVAFDATGNLWRVRANNAFVQVDVSHDLAKTFSKPVNVSMNAQKIVAGGEARPKIAIGPEGNIYVAWTELLNKPSASVIWFARSVNGGKSFENAMIVYHDRAEVAHQFEALNVAPDGKITLVWMDNRDGVAAIYAAASANHGASFELEQKLSDGVCECCRIATINKPDGTVVAMWRHVFEGGERDHMLAEIPLKANQTPVLKRSTFGHWKIDGCPHHGAALAIGGAGKDWWGYHMAYFDGNDKKPGLYYSRMDGVAWASSPAKRFGNHQHQAGHPAILSMGDKVWLVWREADGKNSQIFGMYSDDGGKTWQNATLLASTAGKTDYPQLLEQGNQVYLVWNTQQEGFIVSLITK